jgi:hypothetical protein
MLYPTELRARVIFQSLTGKVMSHGLGKCSRRVLLEVFVNLLSRLRQVPLIDRIVPLPHLLRLMSNDFHGCCRVYPCPT